MHIYYHRDFDGLVAAVIFADFVRNTARVEHLRFTPVDHDRLPGWQDTVLEQGSAVLDFRYNRTAEYWFDHHELSPALQKQIVFGPRVVWNPEFASAASLVGDHLEKVFGYRNRRFEALIRAADVIDSSSFGSPADMVEAREAWYAVAQVLHTTPDDAPFAQVLTSILDGPASAQCLLLLEDFQARRERALELQRSCLEVLRGGKLDSERMLLSHSEIHYAFHKYLPFSAFPEVSLSVGIVGGRLPRVIACKNPWRRDARGDALNIGQLMLEFGGGGHASRGGVPCQTRQQAQLVLEQLTVLLQRVYGGCA